MEEWLRVISTLDHNPYSTPLVGTANTIVTAAGTASTGVTAAGTGPISATPDNTAVADVDGFNTFLTAAQPHAGSAATHTLVGQPAAGSNPAPSGPDLVELAAQGSSLLMSAAVPAPPQPLAPGWSPNLGQEAGFPSDDALASAGLTGLVTGHTGLVTGHTSSAPHVSSLSGPGLSTASYDPSLLLGYNPHCDGGGSGQEVKGKVHECWERRCG
ncbi:unnamed protein product [Tilletia caries]|uniref:Uncharacterized protein n=1 Tax=Tilletia caries TaxID=13290 RepID=A0A177SX82_9BASI|nr:hypothetical protein A4X03_0g9240 [Tilletia caries]CAD6890817.1 unnamed protein product [Tilletia caries]